MENIRALTSDPSVSIEGDVRDLLGQVMEHENIPRKRAKFTNFVKNIRRGVRPTTIDKTWELFEQALKKKDTAPEAKKEEVDFKSKLGDDYGATLNFPSPPVRPLGAQLVVCSLLSWLPFA